MTTPELIKWAMNAEKAREESWYDEVYRLTMSAAVGETKPKEATSTEAEIVTVWLYHAWNEVQDWYTQLFPNEPFNW